MEILEETAIKSLIVKERSARDKGEWSKLRSYYHPNVSETSIHTMWFNGDIDGFIAGSKKLHLGTGVVIHQVIPTDIQFNGSKAVVDCWALIQARLDMNQHEYDMQQVLRLFYRCEKIESQWKLCSLEPIYIRDLLSPVPPAPPLEFGGLENFRKSYRFAGWMLDKRGMAIANDLPGEDDAETVKDIHTRHEEWLKSDGSA